MSLRHTFPACDLPDYRRAEEPRVAPPLARAPRHVSFRTGKDTQAVVAEINGFAHVEVVASVGAGKSTKLPLALAKASGKQVVHLVPHRLLAVDNYDYLRAGADGEAFSLALSPAEFETSAKVVLTTYANFVARLLIQSTSGIKKPFGDAIIVADEVHESDCYTYVVNSLGPTIPGVTSYVKMTATKDPGHYPMRETAGECESRSFEYEDPTKWDVFDGDKPWSLAGKGDNMLLFVDDDRAADNMVARYCQSGASSWRLSAKMDIEAFRLAMRTMRDPNKGVVVLVADYSFRNGFTMNVASIVDSGLVRYYHVDKGSLCRKYRPAFKLEIYQAMGRGGRNSGESVVCWKPKLDFKSALCVLEGVESEAAAVLFRILGFAVPSEIKTLALFSAAKTVPKNLVEALNGFVAVTMLPENAMVPLVYDKPVGNGTSGEHEESAEEVLGQYLESPTESVIDYFEGLTVGNSAVPDRVLNDEQFLEELQAISATARTLVWPNYYGCHGLTLEDKLLGGYGAAWRDALRDAVLKPDMVLGLSPEDRNDMVSVFLLRYNHAVSEAAAVSRVLKARDSLATLSAQYPDIVRKWSAWCTEFLREAQNRGKALLKALDVLRTEQMIFSIVEPDLDYEAQKATDIAQRLSTVVKSAQVRISPASIFQAIDGLDTGGLNYPGEVKMLAADAKNPAGPDLISITLRPVRDGRRRLYDLVADAPSSVMWSLEDYVTAISSVLHKAGMAVSVVRKCVLTGSSVDSRKVMQSVRDSRVANHRRTVQYGFKRLKDGDA